MFAEIVGLPELVSPSARDFLIAYAQGDESVVPANMEIFGDEMMSVDGELRRAVSFLVAFFQAKEGARELFLQRYVVSGDTIAGWPDDLADKLALFLPDPPL
jgi:hypothetical protein